MTWLSSLADILKNQSDAPVPAYGAIVMQKYGRVVARDETGGLIDQDVATSQSGVGRVISSALTTLASHETLFVKKGIYSLNQNISVPRGVGILGAGYDDIQNASLFPTRFRFLGTAKMTLSDQSAWLDKVQLDFGVKTGSEDCLVVDGHYCRLGSVRVWGNAFGCAVRLGDPSSTRFSNKVDHLLITGGNPALICDHLTQSELTSVMSTGATSKAVVLSHSDNLHFGRLQITSMAGGAGDLLTIGADNTTPRSYGERIDYLDAAQVGGFNTIVVNDAPDYSNGDNESTIGHAHIEGTPVYVFNNNSYGALTMKMTRMLSGGFRITTPSLPAGTGVGNAVQNQLPYRVQVFQSGQSGTTILDRSTASAYALAAESNVVMLEPGDKIYYATTIPAAWKWRAI